MPKATASDGGGASGKGKHKASAAVVAAAAAGVASTEAALKMKNLMGIHEDDGNQGSDDNDEHEPIDAKVLKYVLQSMGADKYEPRVVNQLQEFIHRTWILTEATGGVCE